MKLVDCYEFAIPEDDLWDVPDVGLLLMDLPPVADLALRLLPCESACNHLSCEIDRVSINEID